MKYERLVCGGTFDLLHRGHESFLEQIFQLSDKVIIGLTSDSYVSNFKSQNFENFETRKKNLIVFLKRLGVYERTEIQEIDDIYGPLLDKNFVVDAVAVTPQTNRTAIGINETRRDKGLPEISIEVLHMDHAQDEGLISSTRIRNGEISRDGRLYVKEKWKTGELRLPEKLRPELQKPMGKILKNAPLDLDSDKIITIGDITTKNFNDKKVNQIISVIDFQVKREKKFDSLSDLGFEKNIKILKLKNSAGTVSGELFEMIQKILESKSRSVILVDGEEDLVVLPVILVSPLGYKIYYGQPNKGLIELLVSEENKEKAFNLIDQFA